jgi:hypothetical protein
LRDAQSAGGLTALDSEEFALIGAAPGCFVAIAGMGIAVPAGVSGVQWPEKTVDKILLSGLGPDALKLASVFWVRG